MIWIKKKDNNYFGNQFKIIGEIGKGGFGTVYKAEWKEKKKIVAVKVVQKGHKDDRAEQEISIHASLHDRFIVELEDFFQDDYNFYLILEYCDKGSLLSLIKFHMQDFIEDHMLDVTKYYDWEKREALACDIIIPIINAVRYLHSKFIKHRDISLGNILLKSSPSCKHLLVKLADFGIAVKSNDAGENHHTLVGTPGFISPEVYRGNHDDKTDVWSIGCVLYALLVGKLPFRADKRDPKRMPKLDIQDNELSRDAKELIHAMLEINASERPSINELLEYQFLKKYGPSSFCGGCKRGSSQYSSKFSNDSGLDSLTSKKESKFSSYSGKQEPLCCSGYNSEISNHKLFKEYQYLNTKPPIIHTNKENKNFERRKFDHLKGKSNPLPNRKNDYWEHFSSPQEQIKQKKEDDLFYPEKSRSFDYDKKKKNTPVDIERTHQRNNSSSNYPPFNDPKEKFRRNDLKIADLEPLTTTRLPPKRTDLINKCCVVTITEDRFIFLELYEKTYEEQKRIYLVLRISSDGLKVSVYKPKNCFIGEKPLPFPNRPKKLKFYGFDELPAKYDNLYKIAKRFTDIIKARTVKITLHGEHAKCQMMENDPPNFYITFYDGLKLEEIGKQIFIEPENSERFFIPPDKVPEKYEKYLKVLEEMKERCEFLEKIGCEKVGIDFPTTWGKKPYNQEVLKSLPYENMSSQPCFSSNQNEKSCVPSYYNLVSSSTSQNGQFSKPYQNFKDEETVSLKFLKKDPKVKNKHVVAEFDDGIEMWISIKEREISYFYNRRTHQKIINFHDRPELRDRIHYLHRILQFIENKKNRRII